MQPRKNSPLLSLRTWRKSRPYPALIFIIIFVCFGVAIILKSRAATQTLNLQPESGNITGPVQKVAGDTSASGGSYIKFGSSASTSSPEFKGFYLFTGSLSPTYTYCKPSTDCIGNNKITVDETKFLESPLVAGVGMAGSVWGQYQTDPSTNPSDTNAFHWGKTDDLLTMLNTSGVKASNGGNPKNLILRIFIGQNRAPADQDINHLSPNNCNAVNTPDPDGLVDQIPHFVFCPHNGRPGAKFYSWITQDKKTKTNYRAFIPLFWDPSFQADLKDFLTALGAKYQNNKNIMVAIGGPYKAYEENFLPWSNTNERSQWFQKYNADFDPDISTDGANASSATAIQDLYEQFMTSYLFPTESLAFPGKQPLAFALGLGAGDNNNDKNDIYNAFGRSHYGKYAEGSDVQHRGWSIQFNGLQPDITPRPTDQPGGAYVKKMINYIGQNWGPLGTDPNKRGIIGYQFVGGVEPFCTSNACINQGGFRQSIQNAVNYKASYVEVYKSEFQAAYFYDTRATTRIFNEKYDDNERAQAQAIYEALRDLKPSLVSTKP